MAVMHPQDLENYKYTETEKEMYEALKKQLPERFHVFYSIRWFDKDENDKRVDSECDFLVFDPSFGFLTIEVKGGTGIEIDRGTWWLIEDYEGYTETKRELKCSPYEQAEKSMRHFHDYYVDEYNQSFHGVYGCAVAFPRYAIDLSMSHDAPKDLTIDMKDMGNLEERINQIFHYWKNKRNISIPFSAEQRQRFINTINKRISLSAAAGALVPIKEKEFEKINFLQDSVLDILHNYNQVSIIGGAGTGKTYIAIKKAIKDSKIGRKTLITCKSNELAKYIQSLLPDDIDVKCITFDNLMIELLNEEYNTASININGEHCCLDLLEQRNIQDKYDSIIVDEGQDFDYDSGAALRYLLKNQKNSDLFVFSDENQNIFANNHKNVFSIENPPFLLRYNIRNTGNIYNFATSRTMLGLDTIANSLNGVEPEIITHSTRQQSLNTLSSLVNRLIQKEYVSTKSIVVLSDEKFENTILSGETRIGAYNISFRDLNDISENEICFKTTEEFKGLETDIAIYLKMNYNISSGTIRDRCKEYVALTRARYYLYILNTQKG